MNKLILERWKKFIDEVNDLDVAVGNVDGQDPDSEDDNDPYEDDDECLDEWKREDDFDYPSRKEERRLKRIHKPQRTSWIQGSDKLAKAGLVNGIMEDDVVEDKIAGSDAAYMRGIIDQAVKDALKSQLNKNGCTFQQLLKMMNFYSAAEKGKLNGNK